MSQYKSFVHLQLAMVGTQKVFHILREDFDGAFYFKVNMLSILPPTSGS